MASISVLLINKGKRDIYEFERKVNNFSSNIQIVCLTDKPCKCKGTTIEFIYGEPNYSISNAVRFLNNDYTLILNDCDIPLFNYKNFFNIINLSANTSGDIFLPFQSDTIIETDFNKFFKSIDKIPHISNMLIKTSILKSMPFEFTSSEFFVLDILSRCQTFIKVEEINNYKDTEITNKKSFIIECNGFLEQLDSFKKVIIKEFLEWTIKFNTIDFVLIYDNTLSESYKRRLPKPYTYKSYDTIKEQIENISEKCSDFLGVIFVITSIYSDIKEDIFSLPNVVEIKEDSIIPQEHLPNFNESTTEMFLHNIFLLSDNFIYCKGINYIKEKLTVSDFFLSDIPIYEEGISTESHQYLIPLNRTKIKNVFAEVYTYMRIKITQFPKKDNYNIFYFPLFFRINNLSVSTNTEKYGGVDLKKVNYSGSLLKLLPPSLSKIFHFYKDNEEMPFPKYNFSNSVFHTEKSTTPAIRTSIYSPSKIKNSIKATPAVINPKITIIVPCYNVAQYIERCLASIANQTLKDFECLVIDDGSTDNTVRVAKKFEVDKRFRVITKKNSGVSATRNLGIQMAKGEFIGFVDSDDYIAPNRYEICIKKAEELKVDIVRCSIEHIWLNGRKTIWEAKEGLYTVQDRKILSSSEYDNSGCPNVLYRTSLIKKNNIRFRDCSFGEDLIFNAECFCIAGKLYNLNKPLYTYLRHTNSLSTGTPKRGTYTKCLNAFDDSCRFLEKFKNFKDFKDIYKHNFYNRGSMKNMRKNSIDYLVPYVDGSDPNWIKLYNQYADKKIDEEINGMSRFRDDLELFKYQFRGLDKFLPWIDVVHVIVQSESQIPKWLDRNKVHIVYHKDFIPEEYLPTFNSSCIEMFFHNIEGLSEKFIYGNDDLLYTASINKDIFFRDGKVCKTFEVHKTSPKEDRPVWKQIFINSYKLINGKEYSDTGYLVQPHIEAAFLKSYIKEVFDKYKNDILKNSTSRFRTKNNLNQYMFSFYLQNKGLILDLCHSRKVLNTKTDIEEIIKCIISSKTSSPIRTTCINDEGNLTKENKEKIYRALDFIFDKKSFYEV